MIDDPELPKAGVFPAGPGQATFRVWAPKAKQVALVLRTPTGDQRIALKATRRGFHEVEADVSEAGQRYAYSLDGEAPRPDPRSRAQPDGAFGFSEVVAEDFVPRDAWNGIDRNNLVVSEVHVGTFTAQGTFDAAIGQLDSLRHLGINCVELMPVAEFAGERGWGYDGVLPFAVYHGYGGPDGLRRFVHACHSRKMAVILDVIYNHFGPEGNVLPRYGPYFSERTKSDWGPAVNYDGPGSDAVRAMVVDNVRMWVREYGVDGLRIDAADQIYDRSPRHILADAGEVAHREAETRGYPVHVFAETDLNDARRFLGSTDEGNYGLDGYWNDDFHHAAHVVLTGETSGYYSDFADGPRALAKTFEKVFVNDGSYSPFRDRRHGASAAGFSLDRFLAFTQNHDQVGNRLKSDRFAASLPAPSVRLGVGLLLLAPRIPLMFMGQEYGETNPFPYFCDFADAELVEAVREGRASEFRHFGWTETPPDPFAESTRDSAVLSWTWEGNAFREGMRRLHRDLIALRRDRMALLDFSRPVVALAEDGSILEVERGSATAEGLRILFNLTDEPRALDAGLAGATPIFRSEVRDYGSEAEPRAGWAQPREFLIFAESRGG